VIKLDIKNVDVTIFKRLIGKFTSSSASKLGHFDDAAPCANPTWRISEKNKRVRYQVDSSDQTLSEIPLSGQDSSIPKFTTQNENEYDIHDPEIAFKQYEGNNSKPIKPDESGSNCVKWTTKNMVAFDECNQWVHYSCSNVSDNKKCDFNKSEYACHIVYMNIFVLQNKNCFSLVIRSLFNNYTKGKAMLLSYTM
jgi:hypothetical protein